MLGAITDTFSELWNLKDPNAGENPLRARPGKRTEAIRKFLGLGIKTHQANHRSDQNGAKNTPRRAKNQNKNPCGLATD